MRNEWKNNEWKTTALSWLLMILVLATFYIFASCGSSSKIYVPDNTVMEYELDTVVSKHFIDSVCIADTLGTYPDGWIYSPMRGYDTKKNISTYGWMKSSNWTFYRVMQENDSTYRLTKRVVK